MAIEQLTLLTPAEVGQQLAQRLRALRLAKNLTRATLAGRAGVSAASLKRFESTGRASLELVLKVAHVLGRLEELSELFPPPPARSMEELERRAAAPPRKRGRL
jgi:transcriptional regulator with XRE-family HTH domain